MAKQVTVSVQLDDKQLSAIAEELRGRFEGRIKELETALETATRERDLAIAHDRQPYPTAWAYEQACKTIERMRPVVKAAQQWRNSRPLTGTSMPTPENALVATVDAYEAELEAIATGIPGDEHPESICRRCGGPNVQAWSAPSPLWNQVMRGGDINNPDRFDGIVCPVCFAALAEDAGIAWRWRFYAEKVMVPLQTVTPSGRVWNERTWMWDEVSDVHRPTTYLPIGSPHKEACVVCDEPWPCPQAASPETIRAVAVAISRGRDCPEDEVYDKEKIDG